MENLESSKDKIKKICEILKNETLQPAKEEAQKIFEVAQQEALQIIHDAERKVEELKKEAQEKRKEERKIFENSLKLGFDQALQFLRQEIENKLFNDSLAAWLEKQTKDPKVAARLITALVHAIEKEGISADFSALIPKTVSPDEVNAQLVQEILNKLRENSVIVASFGGGVRLKLHDKNLTLDLSDHALKELLGHYIRKDFRNLLFK